MDASEIQQTVKMALIAITLDAFSSPVNTHTSWSWRTLRIDKNLIQHGVSYGIISFPFFFQRIFSYCKLLFIRNESYECWCAKLIEFGIVIGKIREDLYCNGLWYIHILSSYIFYSLFSTVNTSWHRYIYIRLIAKKKKKFILIVKIYVWTIFK